MNARLIEGRSHRPLILLEDGRVGIPVNLHFLSRNDFLSLLGRKVEVVSRLSEMHYTVRLPGAPEHMLPWTCRIGRRGLGYDLGSVKSYTRISEATQTSLEQPKARREG